MILEFDTPLEAANWLRSRVTGTIRTDSRQLQPGDGFIAWPGAATDARQHVASALNSGATACLVELSGVDAYAFRDANVAAYAGLKAASGLIAAAFFEHPSQSLDVLAVTGTNGKTTTAWWLAQALSNLKQGATIPCGLVGTLGIGIVPDVVTTGLTTPDPVLLQQTFRRFVDDGVKACAIEASSIGLEEHRLDGTHIRTAVFTNFTQDHLDYHGSMEAYWQAKSVLFQWTRLHSAVINIDDAFGAALAFDVQENVSDVWTVSCRSTARLRASDIRYEAQGLCFTVAEMRAEGLEQHVLHTRTIGIYNVANLLGVIAAMRTLGVPLLAAIDACHNLSPVPGRMECIGAVGQPLAAVDYAHTPDALGQALVALRSLSLQRGGQLWCIFGCGGDRDALKRPLMGVMAATYADRVVVTSDNPRSEKPEAIISQVLLGLAGFASVRVQSDRALAIAQTFQHAAPNDVVLIAGKGHEDYQEVAGARLPFSDMAHVRLALNHWTPVMMTLQQAVPWLDHAHLVGHGDIAFNRVHTDTRTLAPGDLFVALCGERFNANDFLAEAKAKGAVAALCQGEDAETRLNAAGLPGLVVADTKLALAALATGWRTQFTLPLIAVTGSNGKTTVTQMIAAILRTDKPHAFLATQGNLNNEIGVPLTVLRLRRHHEIAVVELGMNHPGEIATLAAIAQPTVALVNNAQREHLEFMETVEAVAQENGAVIDALDAKGIAVFPSDDLFSAVWATKAARNDVLQFCNPDVGATTAADVVCTQAVWSGDAWQVAVTTPVGALSYTLHIAGQHNVKNSLAAVACTLAAGVPLVAIASGLTAFEPVKGRSRALLVQLGVRDITLVDDTYNANPDSVKAAIDVLAALPAPRLLVLGDMGEVGNQGPQFHAEAGQLARQHGIETLFTLGELSTTASNSFGTGRHFADYPSLQAAVLAMLPHVSSVLVKGSRFMKMERVVDAISAHAQQNKDDPHAA